MAGAFSGHLLNAFNNVPAQPSTPIITSGAMSFNARGHGTPPPFFSPSHMPHSLFGFTPLSEDSTTAKHIASLQAKLNKKLGPEYISQRPGPAGGPKLTYAEGWKIINLANEVFGFNGWSSSVVSIATDFVDYTEESRRFNIGVTAIVRVTLRDGAYHEDVGYGMLENAKSKVAAIDKVSCRFRSVIVWDRESGMSIYPLFFSSGRVFLVQEGGNHGRAKTDPSKFRKFTWELLVRQVVCARGRQDQSSSGVFTMSVKMSILIQPTSQAKFDKNELYRRPEFEERVPDSPLPAPHGQTAVPELLSTRREEPRVKVEHEAHQPETPITYVPRHLRQEVAAAAAQQTQTPARAFVVPPHPRPHAHTTASASGSGTIDAPADRCPPPVDAPKLNGLATPIQTPMRAQRPPLPRAPVPRAVATSPLARIRSAPERSASFAEPMPARVGSGNAADDTGQCNGQGVDEDDDAFPLSTQDDAFLATVDLGEGDLGRPIDFDEGVGSVSMMDTSVLEQPESLPVLPLPQNQHQVRDRTGSESNAGSSSGGPPKTSMRNEMQVQPVAKPPWSEEQGQPQPRSGPQSSTASMSTPSTSSTRAGPPGQDIKRPVTTSMGGFHFPPGTVRRSFTSVW